MSKKLKIYQVLTFTLGLAFVALCLFVGITAVQKSMTLKLGLKMDPAMLCAIYVNDNLVFNNKTSEIASGVSLSANELRLNSTNTFGTYFNLKIENLNEFAINISLSGCTVGEVEGHETAILPEKDTGNIEISSAGLITITMTEAEVYYVQYNANNGGGEMATSTHIIGASSALSANAFTAPSEDVEFAGWATTLTDAQNGVVTYEEGDVILNLGTTDGQTIQLYAVWKMKGYKVTFATNNWAATYEGEEVDSSLVVEPNGDLTVTVAGSGTQEGYSVHTAPTITGTVTSSTFDRYTGTLTLTNIQSDLVISATDFRPWKYYTYGSGEAFEGYTYIKFANDSSTEWVIIGSGDNLTSSLFSTSIDGYDSEKGFGQTYDYNGNALIGPNPNPIDKSANGTGTSKELADNQILLLRRQMLTTKSTFDGTKYYDEWASSVVKNYLNVTWPDLNNYKTHMVAPRLYTTCYKNGISTSTLDDGDDTKIFLLGSRYGSTSSGKLPNVNGELLSYSGYATQNFLLEDYLGTYLSYTAASNPRIFTYDTATSSYWWLRSGYWGNYYEYINAYRVNSSGYVDYNYISYSYGVRPSFILNLA